MVLQAFKKVWTSTGSDIQPAVINQAKKNLLGEFEEKGVLDICL